MRKIIIISVLLGVYTPSNSLFAQKNRISLQQGMFNYFFDEDIPLYNKEKTTNFLNNWKYPPDHFGGHFNDYLGIQYKRTINQKSSVSIEYMHFSGVYQPLYINWTSGPRIKNEYRKKINISYYRTMQIKNKWDFNYGVGVNTQWGQDRWYIMSTWNGLEPHYMYYKRNDFGLNVRTGFDYSPIKQITIFSYVDFHGSVFLSYQSDGSEYLYGNFFEVHGDKIKPSAYNLSFNIGIGYNFNVKRLFLKEKVIIQK
jgi:hypothetical protein